jgi:uncharacterized protein
MRSRPLDPRRLDVEKFAGAGGELAGEWPLSTMPRLAEATHSDARAHAAGIVQWRVRGERRVVNRGAAQIWLHVEARVDLALVCQRCLQAVPTELDAKRSFMFVAGETVAAELDARSEDDILALERWLDLHQLVEDELLLSLPLVPKHDACPQPLLEQAAAEVSAPNPFGVLARLKHDGRHH